MTWILTTDLLRIGHSMDRGAAWRRMRQVSLCIASAAMAVAAVVATLAVGFAQDRDRHMRSVLPVATERDNASLDYAMRLYPHADAQGVVQPFIVVWLAPRHAAAPLPPGVDRWPAPGEAVASPAAIRDLAGDSDIFGRVAGTIAPQGLENADERRIYIRPSEGAWLGAETMPARGFGGPDATPGLWGPPTLYASALWQVISAVAFLLVMPAVIALHLAGGVGAEARMRRWLQLSAMGATRRHVAVVDLARAWPSVTLGSLMGVGVLLVLGLVDVDLRMLDTSIQATQVRQRWGAGLAMIGLSHLVAMVIVLVPRGHRSRWFGMPRANVDRWPLGWCAVSVIAAGAAILLPPVFAGTPLMLLSYYGCIGVVILTMPALVAVCLAVAGVVAARLGWSVGLPGVLLAGRRLAAFPNGTARLVGGVGGLILLFGQVQLITSTLTDLYREGVADRVRFGDSIISAHPHLDDVSGLASFLAQVPDGVVPIWTWAEPQLSSDGTETLQHHVAGSCAALALIDVAACQDSGSTPDRDVATRNRDALAKLVGMSASDVPDAITTQLISEADLPAPTLRDLVEREADLTLVSISGEDLPIATIQRLATQSMVGVVFESIGARAIGSATQVATQTGWLTLWGVMGSVPLLVVAGVVLAASAALGARQTATLALLFERRTWLIVVSLGRIWLPLTLAGALAAVAYLVLPSSLTIDSDSLVYFVPSTRSALMSFGLASTIGGLLSCWSHLATSKAADTWQPGQKQ